MDSSKIQRQKEAAEAARLHGYGDLDELKTAEAMFLAVCSKVMNPEENKALHIWIEELDTTDYGVEMRFSLAEVYAAGKRQGKREERQRRRN